MTAPDQPVLTERATSVLRLTLNCPEARNALDRDLPRPVLIVVKP